MNDLKEIFDKVKDGDVLGFLAAGIKKYPITIATSQPCTHCAIVWLVEREENEVSFNISEQTFTGGKFDRVTIVKIGDFYYAENYHRLNDSEKIYFAPLPKPLTLIQHKMGLDDALSQIGKKYGWISCLFGFSFLEKILPEKIRHKISLFLSESARICSTHVAIQLSKMGQLDYNQEMFYSPYDVILSIKK